MPRPYMAEKGLYKQRKQSKAKQRKIKQAGKQATGLLIPILILISTVWVCVHYMCMYMFTRSEAEGERKARHSLDDLHSAPTHRIHLPQKPIRSSISTTPIRPVTETLIHNCALQAHAVYLTADCGSAAGIHAVIRRVRQILVLEGGIGAPADAAPLVADAPGAPGLYRYVASDPVDQGPAGGLGGFVRVGAGFFRPALLRGGVGGGRGERLALEAEEGLADVRRGGGASVQLDQALVGSVRLRPRDGLEQTLLQLVTGDFDIVGMSVHGERGVQVNEVTVLTLGGGGFG